LIRCIELVEFRYSNDQSRFTLKALAYGCIPYGGRPDHPRHPEAQKSCMQQEIEMTILVYDVEHS
jgi:hypothetical protein